MSYKRDGLTDFEIENVTVNPATTIPARRFVGRDGELSGADLPVLGVSLGQITAGNEGAVRRTGSALVEVPDGVAITNGNYIKPDATGKAIDAGAPSGTTVPEGAVGYADGHSLPVGRDASNVAFIRVFLVNYR